MGVIIEYKGQNRMRIVETAAERRSREYHNAKRVRKAKMNQAHGDMMGSVHREPIRDTWCDGPSDLKCWKNQKHARRNWMRHVHRLKASARILVDNCIYPNMTC
ncbi:MAG: hypothetical protein PVG39_24155 [Desulfobacteraceae bacterium]|jgi:hypothetical protein